jgi:hypothetical protein
MYQTPFDLVHSGRLGTVRGRFVFIDLDLRTVLSYKKKKKKRERGTRVEGIITVSCASV